MAPRVLGEGQGPGCGEGQAGAPWTWPHVSWEKGRGPAVVRGKQEPCGHGPRVSWEKGRGPAVVRGKQEPCGHGPRVSWEKGRATSFFPIQSAYSFISLTNLGGSVKADDGRMPDQLAVNGVRRSGDVKSERHRGFYSADANRSSPWCAFQVPDHAGQRPSGRLARGLTRGSFH